MSVTTFALLSETDVLQSLSHIAQEGALAVRCCMGNDEEFQRAKAAMQKAERLVIDQSALATLFFSEADVYLEKIPVKLVVCRKSLIC
jgi:hypothetical protein